MFDALKQRIAATKASNLLFGRPWYHFNFSVVPMDKVEAKLDSMNATWESFSAEVRQAKQERHAAGQAAYADIKKFHKTPSLWKRITNPRASTRAWQETQAGEQEASAMHKSAGQAYAEAQDLLRPELDEMLASAHKDADEFGKSIRETVEEMNKGIEGFGKKMAPTIVDLPETPVLKMGPLKKLGISAAVVAAVVAGYELLGPREKKMPNGKRESWTHRVEHSGETPAAGRSAS